ncbi:hypothetical protein [Chitinasiproducens palmae]|uniref:Exopolysaccharide production protein YjbE n=1 Tax=Chitinasiproducens palmae TaxID=1770053 RepID=A0A1H2PQC7_9BURK|nr:hypothetical protein [Chitinasiproducens palmae]SDV48590.1 hypothetical protein SAMN05216551_105214 [Chitinasiproducens palmae]
MKATKFLVALSVAGALAAPSVSFAQEGATGAPGISGNTAAIAGGVIVVGAAIAGFCSSGGSNNVTGTSGTTGTTGTL